MNNLRAKIKAIIYHDVDVDRVMKLVTEAHTEAMNKWVKKIDSKLYDLIAYEIGPDKWDEVSDLLKKLESMEDK